VSEAIRILDRAYTLVWQEGAERGNRVLTPMRWTAEGQGSGAQAVLYPAAIWEFEGRLVNRLRFFLDRERARAEFQ
jgi:hypothetical protein